MGFLVMTALCIVAAVLITFCRVVSFRYVLGYGTWFDLIFTLGLMWLFEGTFTGVFAATLAGLIFAVIITVCRYVLGYDKLKVVRRGWRFGIATVHYPSKLMEGANNASHRWYRRAAEYVDQFRAEPEHSRGRTAA